MVAPRPTVGEYMRAKISSACERSGLVDDAGQHAIGLQHCNGSHRDAGQRHGPRQSAPEVHAGQHVLGPGIQVADDAAQPALCAHFFRFAGVPDIHAAEMRAVGRRIADAVDDGHLAGVIQGLDLGQRRVKAELVVDMKDPVSGNPNGGPVVVVTAVGVGNDGVQVVVAAGELDDDEDGVFGGRGHGNVGSAGRINARMVGGRSLAQGRATR